MKILHPLIRLTGHIYLHKYPLWIVYKPHVYRIKSKEIKEISAAISPGDILLRRYDGYLNTLLTPGFWGHAGLYVGDGYVIHAVSAGVVEISLFDFCRTDAVCILSVKDKSKIDKAIDRARRAANEYIKYDFDFQSDNKAYYCTELVDLAYDGIFGSMYGILLPDEIRNSTQVEMELEIK